MPKPVTPEPETTQVKPDPALEKRGRRTFSADYKLRIVQEADVCVLSELGTLLRREKLYNQMQQWRCELADCCLKCCFADFYPVMQGRIRTTVPTLYFNSVPELMAGARMASTANVQDANNKNIKNIFYLYD